jgi:arginyl-tRNA synthetase
MTPTRALSETIAAALTEHVPLPADEIAGLLELPPDPGMGDYALPCFTLAKSLRKAPNAIAADLQERVVVPEGISEARAVGPYLNFFVDRPWLTEATLEAVAANGADYGSSPIGNGETVVIEYSSPNIAKHLSVYHLRSAIIGNSLCRIYQLLGYRALGINFLGDWGTGFGKLVAAFERYGCADAAELSVADLQEMYVRFSREAEQDPGLQQAARDAFRRLEDGDPTAVEPWQAFKAVSLREYERVYRMLGIVFDRYSSESSYADRLQPRVQRMRDEGKAVESEGALVIPLDDEDMPPCLVQKSDGASLYATRDICAAEDRWEEFHFARMLYVVGGEQTLYFNQLRAALRKLGHDWADRIEHVNFGMMRFLDPETGKATTGSTRRGVTVLLDEVLEEAIAKAREKIDQNADRFEPDTDRDALAAQVGIGAVIFGDLSVRRMRDVIFDWDKLLDFEGDTGPYIQYAHARLCSILRKADGERPESVDYSLLNTPEEWTLVRHLARFPEAVRRAGAENEPSVIASYLLELCADFSSYYSAGMRDAALRVLCDDDGVRAARLGLVEAARRVIRMGLGLLGIAAPERM